MELIAEVINDGEYDILKGNFKSKKEALFAIINNLNYPINDADIEVEEEEEERKINNNELLQKIIDHNEFCDYDVIISIKLNGRYLYKLKETKYDTLI